MNIEKPTKEQINTIGLKTDENLSFYHDSYGQYYDGLDLDDAIFCGIFGFSPLGNIKYELNYIFKVLHILKSKDNKEKLEELYKLSYNYQIYLYLLEKHGFTHNEKEFYIAYPTEKGEALYVALNYVLNNERREPYQ